MLTSSKIENIKNNIFFVSNLMIMSNIINHYLVGSELFNQKWLYTGFGILITYICYSLIASEFISVNDEDYKIKKGKEEAIKYLILYTMSHSFTSYIHDGFIDISLVWFIRTVFTIGTYIFFDYSFSDTFLTLGNHKIILLDLIKIFLAEIIGMMVVLQPFDLIELSDIIAYGFSYMFWNLVTKKFI